MKNIIIIAGVCIMTILCGCSNSDSTSPSKSSKNNESYDNNLSHTIEQETTTTSSSNTKNSDSTNITGSAKEQTNKAGNTSEKASPTQLSNDIYSFQIKINDDLYSFPMKYSDFKSLGWTTVDEELRSSLSPNQTSYPITFTNSGYNLDSNCCLGNLGINVSPYSDCYIYEFEFGSADCTDTKATITLPSGIEYGKSTLSDINAAYGDPTSSKDIEDTTILTYFSEYFSEIELTIDKKTQILSGIRIQNFQKQEDAEQTNVSTDVPDIVKKYSAPTSIGDDISSFIVEYAEDLYQLPAPVSEFTKNGWKINEKSSDTNVAAQSTGYIELRKDNQTLEATVTNFSSEATTIENCFVLSVTGWEASTDLPISIPKGITRDMNESELKKALTDIDYEESKSDLLTTYTIRNDQSSQDGITIYVNPDTKKVSGIEVTHSTLTFE